MDFFDYYLIEAARFAERSLWSRFPGMYQPRRTPVNAPGGPSPVKRMWEAEVLELLRGGSGHLPDETCTPWAAWPRCIRPSSAFMRPRAGLRTSRCPS
jgi:hypothetical protein